jgi:hypothetical protein
MTSPTDEEFHAFDDAAVTATLEAARETFGAGDVREITEISPTNSGELELRAQCLSIESANRRVCLKLPLGLGRVCIPLPFDLPDGTAVQACVSIRTIWPGIPTGVCVRITAAGQQLVKRCLP